MTQLIGRSIGSLVLDSQWISCHTVFGVDVVLFLSKVNMKNIPYTPLYTLGFFSLIS
ncbi:hypothetical protein H8356DRAFT_1426184 [Neocallimastix lanati (nom. inval.)]|nr:hypothetical protein H8356DRAFT_1426184 [Neocallimastix sp. JGI-2020a]